MWNDRYSGAGLSLWGRVNLDPGTMMLGATMAMTAAGGAASAAGTLAGGNAAKTAGDLMQQQSIQNAAEATASGQRKMLDTQDRTRMAESTITARAAAGGVDAGVGSPASDVGDVAKRGSYHALMDMFNGQSEAVGLLNQGNAEEWTGTVKQSQAPLAAAGTLAGSAGSMFQQYGRANWPSTFGPRY
jgi:hypothetical protein